MRRSPLILVVVLAAAAPAAALTSYRSDVPNGFTNSCRTCHVGVNGGNPWNDFGKDVLRQDPDVTEEDLASATGQNRNYNQTPVWDLNLCQADSDGDGQSNGQELGDPACVWTHTSPATRAPRTTDISNPGDATSTSANPDGVDAAGEGEGEAGEGEGDAAEGEGDGGEGEGDPPPAGCPGCTSAGDAVPFATLVSLVGLFARPRRRSSR